MRLCPSERCRDGQNQYRRPTTPWGNIHIDARSRSAMNDFRRLSATREPAGVLLIYFQVRVSTEACGKLTSADMFARRRRIFLSAPVLVRTRAWLPSGLTKATCETFSTCPCESKLRAPRRAARAKGAHAQGWAGGTD